MFSFAPLSLLLQITTMLSLSVQLVKSSHDEHPIPTPDHDSTSNEQLYTPVDPYALHSFEKFSVEVSVFTDSAQLSLSVASDIYESGSNPCLSTPTYLDSVSASTKMTEYENLPHSKAYATFYNDPLSWHTFTAKNLDSSTDWVDDLRVINAKKAGLGIMAGLCADALFKAIDLAESSPSCAVHEWDKAWAYYYGVDGTTAPFHGIH